MKLLWRCPLDPRIVARIHPENVLEKPPAAQYFFIGGFAPFESADRHEGTRPLDPLHGVLSVGYIFNPTISGVPRPLPGLGGLGAAPPVAVIFGIASSPTLPAGLRPLEPRIVARGRDALNPSIGVTAKQETGGLPTRGAQPRGSNICVNGGRGGSN